MSTTQVVALAIMSVALVACAVGAWTVLRRRSPQQNSGSEYDRVIAESEARLVNEQALRERQRLHSSLKLRELSPQTRERYAANWRQLQGQFADSPGRAVNEADDLVTRLIEELGYPTADHTQPGAQLSVEHATTLKSYRDAHEISMSNRRGQATTEQLRLAWAHFRSLVAILLGEGPAAVPPEDAHLELRRPSGTA